MEGVELSFGKMNCFITITEKIVTKDFEGFSSDNDIDVAVIKAYKEDRRGTERWANLASFSTASALFRFRRIPNVEITERHFIFCDNSKYNILNVTANGKGMYLEVLAEKTEGSVK